MGLAHGYGLVIGTKQNFYRDNPDNFGRYYHGNLIVGTPEGSYHCAIDVDPKFQPDGVEWRILTINPLAMSAFKAMPDGWHPLPSNADSGALDYVRSPELHPPSGIVFVRYDSYLAAALRWLQWNPPWNHGVGVAALQSLEGILGDVKRCYVFGEPFSDGTHGVHNIHQNQGDPVGGGHDGENAIWQDGATIVETKSGTFKAFLNKFKTQSYKTDDLGKPI